MIPGMMRAALLCAALLFCPSAGTAAWASDLPFFDSDSAYAHEVKPLRHIIPTDGVNSGFNEIRLELTVSPSGAVLAADGAADVTTKTFWPRVRSEVLQWKFVPFQKDGQPVTARVEEYVSLVPPERMPTAHVRPPTLRPDSNIVLSLARTQCYGRCPAYTVSVSNHTIVFNGAAFVASEGRHTANADPAAVRKLAQKFIDSDFYSMAGEYRGGVTDNPTYILSISIDGHARKVVDYVGQSVGMPAVIHDLENDVDELAQTDRWIK